MIRPARIPLTLSILAALCLSLPAEAKTAGRLSGTVFSRDGNALIGAVITIFKEERDGGTILYTRSDRKGEYKFQDVSPGSYSLHVNMEGYKPLVKPSLAIKAGATTALNVILLDLLDLISSDDPRNQGITSVLRSTSDRRLIFRADDAAPAPGGDDISRFERNATLKLASSAELSSSSVHPASGYNDVVSNFAYSEPITQSGRMIFAGQLSAGYGSFWRVQNTLQFQPENGRDIQFTLGYGRQNLASSPSGAFTGPAQFFSQDPSLRDTGVQTVTLGFTSRDHALDIFSIEYGFDLTRVHRATSQGVFSPHFRLTMIPAPGWTFRSAMASRRVSDANSVMLPDGESINLAEPVYLADIDGRLQVSNLRHLELGVERELGEAASIEISVYEDGMEGPGIPFMLTISGSRGRQSRLVQLREDQTEQRGLKVGVNRRLLDRVDGSIDYIYGTNYTLAESLPAVRGISAADDLSAYMGRENFHALTGTFRSYVPRTKTDLTAVVRWYPGNLFSPIDLFSDRKDIRTKGVAFFIRQSIPMPEFINNAGEWVALVDVRNLFDQGKQVIPTADGELILKPSPRFVRIGLNLNFH